MDDVIANEMKSGGVYICACGDRCESKANHSPISLPSVVTLFSPNQLTLLIFRRQSKRKMRTSQGSGVALVVLLLIFSLCAENAQGLRGCSNFGHSCFGAHGKRTGGEILEESDMSDDNAQYQNFETILGNDVKGGGGMSIEESNPPRRLPVNFLRILRNMMRNLESGPSSVAGRSPVDVQSPSQSI